MFLEKIIIEEKNTCKTIGINALKNKDRCRSSSKLEIKLEFLQLNF